MANSELEAMCLQDEPSPFIETVCRSMFGSVASLAITMMKWPSLVHWTVTGDTEKGIERMNVSIMLTKDITKLHFLLTYCVINYMVIIAI